MFFFIHADKLKLLSLLFPLFLYFHFWVFVSSSQHFVFVHALCFILEYLMQHLKALKNSQVSNDYNTMSIITNHVSQCYKRNLTVISLSTWLPLNTVLVLEQNNLLSLYMYNHVSSVYKSVLLLLQYSIGHPSTYCYLFE